MENGGCDWWYMSSLLVVAVGESVGVIVVNVAGESAGVSCLVMPVDVSE